MPDTDLTYFQLLKRDIARQLRMSLPEVTADMEQWKGKEIRCFQEDLMQKVNGRISEKWFYTHIKSAHEHVPRIDILNLLSQYVGYAHWEAYKAGKGRRTAQPKVSGNIKQYVRWVGLLIVPGLLLAFYISSQQSSTYQFCFINAYSRQPVRNANLDVIILHEDESPYRVAAGKEGCISIDTREDHVQFVVRGPYYQTDTISRVLDKGHPEEQIALKTNDYAWMIRIFSSSSVDDWQKRRAQLDSMIREDARIYQIFDKEQVGMEMYNKWEFIDKLTMPLKSLRHIEVLETLYEDDKIKELRFKQVNPESDE